MIETISDAMNSMKTCARCKESKGFDAFRKDVSRKDKLYPYCAECLKEIGRDYRRRHPGQNTKRFLAWKERNPEKASELVRSSSRKYRARLKDAVMEAYSGQSPCCACCGESHREFLAIDHVNGGGNKHRREIKVLGWNFYKWLVDNKFPSGFQVLCHNCNFAKSHGACVCPHTRKRAEVA